MLPQVRLMFLTAVLALFATFPAISAPVNGGNQDLVDTHVNLNGSFNLVGIVPASINHDIDLMPDDGRVCFHCPYQICSQYGPNDCDYHPPAIGSVSLISFYIYSGDPANTAGERQPV